ncbi:magnesium protoporphyrin IX methyltransferase [Synechococcus elongatus]|uniref:Magnesium protoporphyrin IX methyltransferase n=2 Tax=Synechococcus elongatus TaxID=32046 RepID=Q31R48_SYNE7|nr:magnesium protoporphyrin IX methyltransferase [Synechococcus elongatus]ABB56471.1 magnesium protoporphyrin O-methyltransferase [Synechococcus elongatus PCC 7942 = FACHB-805]AJD56485.1 Mg-protoporphyrin IX methyl transferase [Synechococcus elongatus UTEX 2973]MBD2588947.1 magnesium protoporphyrin IX methyltransferase [Synechococcus elongatus FACHB-242]MBD2690013.1 magnesium protoporphyrin IX methyltransferase [Synechococcus elongatus FACHB-1061]MBD2706984.1 magnesium protoporphyrin IX methyl
MTALDDKTIVRDYFNATGFDRWSRIYGDGEVNFVQKNIRIGHQRTVDTVLSWLEADGNLSDRSFCDAGCGVGSLSLPLAQRGAQAVYASDISAKMVEEARERASQIPNLNNIQLEVSDLASLSGRYDTVICLDVLIHYPESDAAAMLSHLCSLAEQRVLVSFAPKSPVLNVLKRIGQFFPGASKTTRAYQHSETAIAAALAANGFQVQRRAFNKAPFYFSLLLEAVRTA